MPNVDRIAADYDALEFHVQLDFFLSETSERADVVLPSAVWAEDAGVATNAEGRIVLRHRAADPPGEARPDWWILCEIARRLGHGRAVRLRLDRGRLRGASGASAGGIADYSGVTYERLEETGGMFWPVPSEDHPGTPRLFEDGRLLLPGRPGQVLTRRMGGSDRARRRRVSDAAHHRAHGGALPVG